MNIIKLKDEIKPGDDFFNNHLKGRYAFWVQMRYIVSFDHMTYMGYVACESDISNLLITEDGTYPEPFGCPYIDTSMGVDCDIYPYIDETETDRINSIQEFIAKNKYVTDSDITVDELKKFRTWLATQLLSFDQNSGDMQLINMFDEHTTNMLTYYKNGMIDSVIDTLIDMSKYDSISKSPQSTCCDCGCHESIPSFEENPNTCNPVSVYKRYMYNKMVLTFSEVDFWTKFPTEFILEFKKYIDNIIRLDFVINKKQMSALECGCSQSVIKTQSLYKSILTRLSESLSYIANSESDSHKLFIRDALYEWASELYEYMEW